jgi:hypothetical protein
MTSIRASRVNLYLGLQTLALHYRLHDGMSRWRATYISQTYEQYLLFHNVIKLIIIECKDTKIIVLLQTLCLGIGFATVFHQNRIKLCQNGSKTPKMRVKGC